MSDVISKEFYSNCLIEAIKAKIKHPIKVKIKCIPANLNEAFCPHYMWHDGEYTYDFWTNGLTSPLQFVLHKGVVRRSEYGYYDRCIRTLRERKRRQKWRM